MQALMLLIKNVLQKLFMNLKDKICFIQKHITASKETCISVTESYVDSVSALNDSVSSFSVWFVKLIQTNNTWVFLNDSSYS